MNKGVELLHDRILEAQFKVDELIVKLQEIQKECPHVIYTSTDTLIDIVDKNGVPKTISKMVDICDNCGAALWLTYEKPNQIDFF